MPSQFDNKNKFICSLIPEFDGIRWHLYCYNGVLICFNPSLVRYNIFCAIDYIMSEEKTGLAGSSSIVILQINCYRQSVQREWKNRSLKWTFWQQWIYGDCVEIPYSRICMLYVYMQTLTVTNFFVSCVCRTDSRTFELIKFNSTKFPSPDSHALFKYIDKI